jgi:hypothetical protein
MSTVTPAQVAERLKHLTPAQLSAVYDFVGYLAERSGRLLPADLPVPEHPVTKIEELRMDFWPVDDSIDDFLAARELWRAQDLVLESGARPE